jgi:hypothetical protein
MEPEEPIVAAYRNTYEMAVRRDLRQIDLLTGKPARRGREPNIIAISALLIGTICIVGVSVLVWIDPEFRKVFEFGDMFTADEWFPILVGPGLVLAFFWFVAAGFGRRIRMRMSFRLSRTSNRAVILTIRNDAIVTHVEGEDRRYEKLWRALTKVVRVPDGFVLATADHWSMAWIPLEAFKSERDIERFAQLARDNVREYVVMPE